MKKLFVFLLFTGLISFIPSSLHPLFSSSLSAQIPSNGLVAWYPFNGNANDESGNGNNGVVNGAMLTADRFGNPNGAYSFNGNVSTNITVDLSSSIQGVKSFSLWLKVEQNFVNPYCHLITCSGTANDYLSINGNHPSYQSSNTTGKFYDGKTGLPSLGYLNDFAWHHLILIHDYVNLQSRLYIDGQFQGSSNSNNFLNDPIVSQLAFGSAVNNVSWANTTLTGILDDIVIYNRSLTTTEIQQLYQDQTGQVQQPLTCNITAATTTLCAGESVNLSISSTGGAGSSAQLPANLQQGLVAYYPFNGNANDESGNGNNGTVNGATLTSDRFGNANGAYSFDGVSDFISLGQMVNSNFSSTSSFSYSFWFKSDALNFGRLLSFTSLQPDLSFVHQVTLESNGVLSFNCAQNTGLANPPYGEVFSNVVFDSDLWRNVIVKYDNGNLEIYIDQVFIASSNYTGPAALDGVFSELNIGYTPIEPQFKFGGKFDELLIYNRALSPTEIQQLYTSQSYVWNTGATTNSITVSPTTSTTYNCTVTSGSQTCTASVEITVNPAVTNDISATIIEGESYTLGTQTFTTAGTYTEVFTSAAGCDSTVTLTLAVEPLLTCNITAATTTLCAGESVNLTVSATGGAGSSSQLPANLQQGLVAYYPFNGNANDESGNGNDGVVFGNVIATSNRLGELQSAFDWPFSNSNYNSSAYIDLPNLDFQFETKLTISFWIYKYSGTNGGDPRIFGRHESGLIFNANSSNIKVFLGIGISGFSSAIPENQWVHIVYTSDSSMGQGKFYINGALVNDDQTTPSNELIFSNDGVRGQEPWNIGRKSVSGFDGFGGKLDEIFFYNRALNSNEIQQLYTAQSYAWNTGATTNTITVSPTTSTTYSCTVTQGAQTCTASVDITVNPAVSNEISATIIEGESYTLGAQTLTIAGTYTEVFTSAAGCDSTVTLTLAVEPLLTCNITAATTTLCAGESVNLSIGTSGGAGSSSQLPANLQQGLVAYYPFNGNANDESGNGNNGTVNGATLTSDRFGNVNGAYSFNGLDNFIDFGNLDYISTGIPNEYSISIWINPNSLGNYPLNNLGSLIFGDEINQNNGVILSLNNNFGFNVYNAGQNIGACNCFPQINQWINYCVVQSSSGIVLYINGVYWGVLSNILNVETSTPTRMGYFYQFQTRAFDGYIDDTFVFNRALSSSEIQQLYTSQSFAWNTGATTPSITVTPTTNTTYSCTVTQGSQTCTTSVDIMVTPQENFYADADGDGFGDINAPQSACEQPVGFVSNANDCNDNEALAFIGATDICDNGIDEDCSGTDSTCIVLGCTDVAALNFNPEANTDDGSCIAVVLGCTDASAFNYNAAANTDDGSCIPVVLGCTNSSACNFNELANTDDNSCILPQTETCNGLDDNCDGQVDEGLTLGSVTATSVTTALYPTCSGNALKSANLNNGVNSPIIDGNGMDLWYSMTAQYNTLRASLSAAFGDNEIRLYSYNNGCFELMETEHEVYTASSAATGNQVLITDDLLVGQTYYIAVHNISGPMNSSAKMCFNHFVGSTCDHYYSNYTGVYNNVCTSFKAQYKGNATNYIFDILSATQNNANLNITPWSYTTTTANSVVPRLGTIFPVNMSNAAKVYTLRIPVIYAIPDAAGNYTSITANATTTCTVTLNAELPIALRAADRCPNTKTTTSSISVDRTICGAQRYEWEFTQQLPSVQSPVTVLGGLNTTVFFLNNVPGMGTGKTYNVRVRPIHANGEVGNWGTAQCLKTGTSGMIVQSESDDESAFPIHRFTDSPIHYAIYPNPTSTGHFTLLSNSTEEEVKQIAITDVTGKMVFQSQVVMNGNSVEVEFGDFATGMYLVMVGEERIRLIVE